MTKEREISWKSIPFSECSEDEHKEVIDFIKGLSEKDSFMMKFAISWLLLIISERDSNLPKNV